MEYSRSFALIEAVALVALTAWLVYLNRSSPRRGSNREDIEKDNETVNPDENTPS